MNVSIKHTFPYDEPKDADDKEYKIVLLGDPSVGKTCLIRRLAYDSFPYARGFGNEPYKPTIGLDFYKRTFTFPPTSLRTTEQRVTLHLWDIGGKAMQKSNLFLNYISGAHAIILCYDITQYNTFQSVDQWYQLIKKTFNPSFPLGTLATVTTAPRNPKKSKRSKDLAEASTASTKFQIAQSLVASDTATHLSKPSSKPMVIIMGLKKDLMLARAVPIETHTSYARENQLYDYRVSSKSGENVGTAFYQLASDLASIPIEKHITQPDQTNQIAFLSGNSSALKDQLVAENNERNCIIQ